MQSGAARVDRVYFDQVCQLQMQGLPTMAYIMLPIRLIGARFSGRDRGILFSVNVTDFCGWF